MAEAAAAKYLATCFTESFDGRRKGEIDYDQWDGGRETQGKERERERERETSNTPPVITANKEKSTVEITNLLMELTERCSSFLIGPFARTYTHTHLFISMDEDADA